MTAETYLRDRPAAAPRPEASRLHRSPEARRPIDLHRRLPGYAPTPLVTLDGLARRLSIGGLWAKVERSRFGLPSFKLLGASWAIYQALEAHLGETFEPWQDIESLASALEPHRPLTLVAATDGNHGRAVAHMARLLHLRAQIFVPRGTAAARIDGIRSEGATCSVVDGNYDVAVERAAAEAGERTLVISDTSWPGYEAVPNWVQEGYETMFDELDEQLDRLGTQATHVLVPIGVGALGAALVRHLHLGRSGTRPVVIGVEPLGAACVLASLRAGRLVQVEESDPPSIMAGLNCATPSAIAWPWLEAGLDSVVAIDDVRAEEAMRHFADVGIATSETGAATLGGLLELLGADHADLRRALRLDESAMVVLLVTEGVTDPEAYVRIVGKRPSDVDASTPGVGAEP